MSNRLVTKKLEVGKLRPGMKIEFPKVYAIVRDCKRAQGKSPTIGDNVFLLELIGDCGPFKGKKPRLIVNGSDKLEVVQTYYLPIRIIKWLWDLCTTQRKPWVGSASTYDMRFREV